MRSVGVTGASPFRSFELYLRFPVVAAATARIGVAPSLEGEYSSSLFTETGE